MVTVMAKSKDPSVRIDALWALSYLSDGTDEQQAIVARQKGLSEHVITELLSTDPKIITPALRVVGNLMSGENTTMQLVINDGALPKVRDLLNHGSHSIRKEACWCISNVMAGTPQQIRTCLETGILPMIIKNCLHVRNEVRREASWCLVNAFSGIDLSGLPLLAHHPHVLPLLCDMVSDTNRSLAGFAIRALHRALFLGDVYSVISGDTTNPFSLLIHARAYDAIFQLALSGESTARLIIENYFSCHSHVDPSNLDVALD